MNISERARQIAEKANECCNRTDGFEEEILDLAEKHLIQVWHEAHEDVRKLLIEEILKKLRR